MVVDPEGEQPSPELLEAFALAKDYVEAVDRDVELVRTERPRWRPRAWYVWSVLVAAVVLAFAYYPALCAPDTPEAPRLEADLRWAVANVVREVESARQRRGRLPEAAALHGLLSDAVTYQPAGDNYRVVGTYGSVTVVYDGTQPLEEWAAARTY